MKFCPNCGTSIAEGTGFCPNCGLNLNAVNATAFVEANDAPPMSESFNVDPSSLPAKKPFNKKWLIPGIAAVLVIVLVAVFALTMGGGLNKNDAIRFEVEDLTCYVPSDWEYSRGDVVPVYEDYYPDDDVLYESYILEFDDGFLGMEVDYYGKMDVDEFNALRAELESIDEEYADEYGYIYRYDNYSVRGTDESFLYFFDYEDDGYVGYSYHMLWDGEWYAVHFVSEGGYEDEELFEAIVKSLEYNG